MVGVSGGSRNLRTRECCTSAVYFFRSEDCFDAPSYIPYAFVVRVENEIHIVNIACWLHLSLCVLWRQNFQKYIHKKNFKQGGAIRRAGAGSSFGCWVHSNYKLLLITCHHPHWLQTSADFPSPSPLTTTQEKVDCCFQPLFSSLVFLGF